MLKNKLKKLEKSFKEIYPERLPSRCTANRKYTLDDWTIDDIRKVVFPEGREIFDSDNQELCEKWSETNWSNNEYLDLLTVNELKKLESWLEESGELNID